MLLDQLYPKISNIKFTVNHIKGILKMNNITPLPAINDNKVEVQENNLQPNEEQKLPKFICHKNPLNQLLQNLLLHKKN